MSDGNSGWPDYPVKQVDELAPLAPLAGGGEIVARDAQGRFLTGNIGGGRKRGSRNRLTETFIAAVETDFAEHGPEALAKLRADDPAAYLRVVASLIPRDLILKREQTDDYSGLGIEELEDILERERHNGMFAKLVQQARRGY